MRLSSLSPSGSAAMHRHLRRRGLLRVASHNIMDGLFLRGLLARYRRHQRGPHALHALCIQEAVPHAPSAIAAALGRRFAVVTHSAAPRLALIYDRSRLRLRGLSVVMLPMLSRMHILQALYTRIEQRHAIVGRFHWRGVRRPRSKCGLALANFHLDTAGDNLNRAAQLASLATAIDASRPASVVACGDTNCFSWDATVAEAGLARMLAPLARRHGARDAHAMVAARPCGPRPTHFFARANEPKLWHRLAVLFGTRLGLDFPRRYDVVAASPQVLAAGTVETPESDHDLVWAALRPPG